MSEQFKIKRATILWDGREGWLQVWQNGRWEVSWLSNVATPGELRRFAAERSMGFCETMRATVAQRRLAA